MGRVGTWRGCVRSGMSVSASFVWRCLSGSTITPIERGGRISRTTLSDKISRLHPRHVVPKPGQAEGEIEERRKCVARFLCAFSRCFVDLGHP